MDYNKRKFDGGHFKWPFNDKRVKFLHNFIQPQLLLQVYGHHPDDDDDSLQRRLNGVALNKNRSQRMDNNNTGAE